MLRSPSTIQIEPEPDARRSSGRTLAKPVTNNAIGVLIDPMIGIFDRSSIKAANEVIPQAKNIKDSYKLLNGK